VKNQGEIRAGRPVAVVIGASTGIGAALGRKLVERGFLVALVARQREQLDSLAAELNARFPGTANNGMLPVARPYPHDVRDFNSVAELFDRIRRDMGECGGELSVVVYAAGIMPPGEHDHWAFEEERATVETNLLGAMAWLDASADVLRRIGRGTIVGISSVAGDRGRKGNSAYMASKAGLTTYLESLRYRLHGTGVRVVTVKPGYVATPMTAGMKLPRPLTISADEAAGSIARLCMGGRTVAYIPGYWRLIMLVVKSMPAALLVRLPI
jgi:NAD(P)-dependent dehydrogenase (short-subunit alcohol dehydrogenase family)